MDFQDAYAVYLFVAMALATILGILTYLRGRSRPRSTSETENEGEPQNTLQQRMAPEPAREDGPRNRVIANRNARARMRVAQAQRQVQHSDSEGEGEDLPEDLVLPEGKIGKKKLAKLQMKAEKKAMREAEEREREEKKEREAERFEKMRQVEREREEEEAQKEEEERLKREEEAKREQEEYEKLKVQFEVEEEGYGENLDEEQTKNLLQQFVQYIKKNKVVVLEDLAALFDLKTQAVIDRITELQKEGVLSGVIDDRGKFIYITHSELQSVAKFIRQRGRVTLSDIAEASNTLINLQPECEVGSD